MSQPTFKGDVLTQALRRAQAAVTADAPCLVLAVLGCPSDCSISYCRAPQLQGCSCFMGGALGNPAAARTPHPKLDECRLLGGLLGLCLPHLKAALPVRPLGH